MSLSLSRASAARLLASATLLATSTLAMPAFAHVSLAQAEASAGSHYRATLRVPHGCDGSATTAIRVQIPDDVISVKPMPKAGWTLTTQSGAYKKAYEDHGRSVSEGVKEIVWSGGRLPDAFYDEFVFTSRIATEGGGDRVLYFPVTQTCETGEAAWTEIAAADQSSHDLKRPAPTLRIKSAPATVAQAADAGGAQEVKVGDLTISATWTRATPGGAKVAGGYFKITNRGAAADRLIGGSSDLAGRLEIHTMNMNNGVMQMRPLQGGLEIKPGETVELKPGGNHLMFMDIKRQLKEGDTVRATLTFEKAGKVDAIFKVGPIGGGAPAEHHHHH